MTETKKELGREQGLQIMPARKTLAGNLALWKKRVQEEHGYLWMDRDEQAYSQIKLILQSYNELKEFKDKYTTEFTRLIKKIQQPQRKVGREFVLKYADKIRDALPPRQRSLLKEMLEELGMEVED